MNKTHLSQCMLDAWLLLLLRLCSVIKLSSSSSSMRNGCRDVGSSSRQEYCRRKGWDRAASAVNLSMGLKVKICSRKSTAERERVEDEVKKNCLFQAYCCFTCCIHLPSMSNILRFLSLNAINSPCESTSGSKSRKGFFTFHP